MGCQVFPQKKVAQKPTADDSSVQKKILDKLTKESVEYSRSLARKREAKPLENFAREQHLFEKSLGRGTYKDYITSFRGETHLDKTQFRRSQNFGGGSKPTEIQQAYESMNCQKDSYSPAGEPSRRHFKNGSNSWGTPFKGSPEDSPLSRPPGNPHIVQDTSRKEARQPCNQTFEGPETAQSAMATSTRETTEPQFSQAYGNDYYSTQQDFCGREGEPQSNPPPSDEKSHAATEGKEPEHASTFGRQDSTPTTCRGKVTWSEPLVWGDISFSQNQYANAVEAERPVGSYDSQSQAYEKEESNGSDFNSAKKSPLDLTRYGFCKNSQSTMSQDERSGDQGRNPTAPVVKPFVGNNLQGSQFDRSQAAEFRPRSLHYPAKFGLPTQSTMSQNDYVGGQRRNPSTLAAYPMANSNIQGRQFDQSQAGEFRPPPLNYPAKFGLPAQSTMSRNDHAGGQGRNPSTSAAAYPMANSNIQGRQFDLSQAGRPQPVHFSAKFGPPSLHTMAKDISAGAPGRKLSASDAEPFRPPQPMQFPTKLRLNYHPSGWIKSPVVSRKKPLSGFPTDQNAK